MKVYLGTPAEGTFSYSKDVIFQLLRGSRGRKRRERQHSQLKHPVASCRWIKRAKSLRLPWQNWVLLQKQQSQALKPHLKYSPAKSMTPMHVSMQTLESITTVLQKTGLPHTEQDVTAPC